MKRRGFTLAEVLITLGIIGVVAALTAPALVQNANSAKVGPKLAKAVSTFELANEAMLNEAGTSSIKGMGFKNESDYISELSNYMRIHKVNEDTKDSASYQQLLKNYSGKTFNMVSLYDENGDAENYENNVKYDPIVMTANLAMAKDGTLYGIELDSWINSQAKPHKYAYGAVIIDINGKAEPNKIGKDAFVFVIMGDGSLEPFGSNGAWDTSYEKCNATSVVSGFTCGASIFENDLKVIYQ